jgi:uncharacterized protein (TIGR00369 family)
MQKVEQWQVHDPEYRTRVQESFQQQAFMRTLDVELTSVEPGYCEMRLPFNKSLTQQDGYFHAGVMATIADNSAGYAAFSLVQPGANVLSVEFKVNLLSPGKGEFLLAKASVIKNGRTLKICQTEVFNEKEGELTLCAIATVTLIEIQSR